MKTCFFMQNMVCVVITTEILPQIVYSKGTTEETKIMN